MKDLFTIINGKLQKYNGEILKRSVGNIIVKVISNPTEKDLKEFGYMEFVPHDGVPEYDPQTEILNTSYEIKDGKIYENLKIIDINPVESEV